MKDILVDSAKVMAKGQITLPKDIRDALGLSTGDRVMLVRMEDRVIMMNSAVYALRTFQKVMAGKAAEVGITSDDDVVKVVMEMRAEEEK